MAFEKVLLISYRWDSQCKPIAHERANYQIA